MKGLKLFIAFLIVILVSTSFNGKKIDAEIADTTISLSNLSDGATIDNNNIINLQVSLNFKPSTKPGDRIEFTLPKHIDNYNGQSSFNVMDESGKMIGSINYADGKLIFTASDYFNDHYDVKGSFNIITKPSREWENGTSKEIGVNVDGVYLSTGKNLNLKVSTHTGYSESLTPIQYFKENVSDILHMYSTPQFTQSGRHTVDFVSDNYPDAYYNCAEIEKNGVILGYGQAKNNTTKVNTVRDAQKYNIKVLCSPNKVTISMDVNEGFGYTTALPVLLSDQAVNAQSPDTFWFSNSSVTPDGKTWNGRKPLNFIWQNANGNGHTNKPKPIDPPEPPTKPEEPVKPEPPTKPEEPVKPEPPTKPEEPVKPEPPTKPEEPVKPEPPTKPEEPVKPEPPTKPVEPVKPEPPTKPEEPVKPEEPTKPEEPSSVNPPSKDVKPNQKEHKVNESSKNEKNKKQGLLPQTGEIIQNNPITTILIIGLLFTGIGLIFYKRKDVK